VICLHILKPFDRTSTIFGPKIAINFEFSNIPLETSFKFNAIRNWNSKAPN
jgi:hypothetical protein